MIDAEKSARTPDFSNVLAVLQHKKPPRPTLFEFLIDKKHCRALAGEPPAPHGDGLDAIRLYIRGFSAAGFDYAPVPVWEVPGAFTFPRMAEDSRQGATISLNDNAAITGRDDFKNYPWPDPGRADYTVFNRLKSDLCPGMKFVACAHGGILENVIALTGYERLAVMLLEDPGLAAAIFDAVGSRLLGYYELVTKFDTVGAVIYNDDWGFKTQTMFSPQMLRELVFPWCKKIVNAIHGSGKPAILHSCGNLAAIMDDIIDDMRFDAKHSFEDGIVPVEQALRYWGHRIAILGGIDVDFLCRSPETEIRKRARGVLSMARRAGGYALGSGNSIPDYVPLEKFRAMTGAALEYEHAYF